MTSTTINPYLAGNFAPVREEITAENLQVLGELPIDLCGMFVRNGPNPQLPPSGKYHWFSGDGMLHGVLLHNGKAEYRNRYVRTQKFLTEQNAAKSVGTGLLEPRQRDNFNDLSRNTANTALIWQAGQLLALWEGGEPHAIKLPELETVGAYSFNGKLVSSVTAHPKVNPSTGEMLFFGYSVQPPYLQYSVVSASGELLRTVPIDLPEAVMMHDFAITENYTIFMDLPLTFSIARMQQGQPLLMFEQEKPSRFGILPHHGDNSSIRWFESPACYVVHTLNAYEEGDEVVLIGCHMTATTMGLSQTPDHPDADIPRLYRWRFNLSTGTVKEEMLDDVSSEFPRINEQLLGRKTRYGYTAKLTPGHPTPAFEGLIKYDFSTGASQTLKFGSQRYGGEAVFVPRADAVAEDDGWLLTFVHDEGSDTSELVVVNAQDFTAEPVARVLIPQRVPYGFHGTWVSQEQLSVTQ